MKNIQVINGALNCTFSVFQATDEEFALLFPEPRQDIQYVEYLVRLRDSPRSTLRSVTSGNAQFASRKLKVFTEHSSISLSAIKSGTAKSARMESNPPR